MEKNPKYGKVTYYDKNGWEIRNGDVLKTYHFSRRKRIWYMWKIAHYLENWGWVAYHTGSEFGDGERFNLSAISNEDGILTDTEIVSLDVCFEHSATQPKRKRLTPPLN